MSGAFDFLMMIIAKSFSSHYFHYFFSIRYVYAKRLLLLLCADYIDYYADIFHFDDYYIFRLFSLTLFHYAYAIDDDAIIDMRWCLKDDKMRFIIADTSPLMLFRDERVITPYAMPSTLFRYAISRCHADYYHRYGVDDMPWLFA